MSFGVGSQVSNPWNFQELGPPPPSSHRAECTGCLAGALFCYKFMQFTTQAYNNITILVVSDNQGMVKSLNDRMSYTKVFPNSTLTPDRDLLEEIVATYRKLKVSGIKFEWVKGHQDTALHDHELTPQAIYNIRSDQLANEYTSTNGVQLLPESPLLPSTRCQLHIHGNSDQQIAGPSQNCSIGAAIV
jgi:ribonuclease HI